ncbi:16S rRNA methyltransferase [Candidatus Paracaedimonas acanthamoebae]|nr:16S rRNA methyltransferase [Candidatus Paracaedimonas acanthamoebae]
MTLSSQASQNLHFSVMLNEVLSSLHLHKDGIYVDGTFGVGGYSRAILQQASCTVLGIDRDPQAVKLGHVLEQENSHFKMIYGRFSQMKELLESQGIKVVDGIALDLGVSSPQLDQKERGFSFRFEGPLDMRMGQEGMTAAEVVNYYSEVQLSDIIFNYGEERYARRIARAIIKARAEEVINTTLQLANIVRSVVPKSRDGIDPATRTFQGLRIYINRELEELSEGLKAAEALLAPGGRLVVVCFHSLEDRIVKDFFRKKSQAPKHASRHLPMLPTLSNPTLKILTAKPLQATPEEISVNPRSRSAKLRVAEKLENASQEQGKLPI